MKVTSSIISEKFSFPFLELEGAFMKLYRLMADGSNLFAAALLVS
jgi:hypothetical protein